MHNTLFLLCPTDGLEPKILKSFKGKNYFYCSLGNSFSSDVETIEHIKAFIIKNDITSVCFITSMNNKIILDALGKQYYSDIRGLRTFYNQIRIHKRQIEKLCLTNNYNYSILSYFLNKKIKELEYKLGNLAQPLLIRGMIYNRQKNTFQNIYSSLICLEEHVLN